LSIKGSAYRWLKQALERSDLPLVKASAAQLPAVDLPTALDIALLVMEQEPHNGERAAVRWLGRWALESREATLAGLLEATVAMSALVQEPDRWESGAAQLGRRCTGRLSCPPRYQLSTYHRQRLGRAAYLCRRPSRRARGVHRVAQLGRPRRGPPMHLHHLQEEGLTVERGTIGYKTEGGPEQTVGPGETVTFLPGEAHRFWNAGDEELVCTGFIRPPDNVEYFLTEMYASMRRSGGDRPGRFDGAYLGHRYRTEFEMTEVPKPVRRLIFRSLPLPGACSGCTDASPMRWSPSRLAHGEWSAQRHRSRLGGHSGALDGRGRPFRDLGASCGPPIFG